MSIKSNKPFRTIKKKSILNEKNKSRTNQKKKVNNLQRLLQMIYLPN